MQCLTGKYETRAGLDARGLSILGDEKEQPGNMDGVNKKE